ncbi:hypothetical protein [Maricaulis parjimensis]|uniref:hypothetical protein n=1 Tax=Maricaulis parjimensis TaxID=144023 RepID=UPI001939AD1E|nr:hypothetical protein [Maricaulis parjimensis]
MRQAWLIETGAGFLVCCLTALALQFISLERYELGLPLVMALMVGLCVLPMNRITKRQLLLPAAANCAITFALVAAGVGFPVCLILGLALTGLGHAIWTLHSRGFQIPEA